MKWVVELRLCLDCREICSTSSLKVIFSLITRPRFVQVFQQHGGGSKLHPAHNGGLLLRLYSSRFRGTGLFGRRTESTQAWNSDSFSGSQNLTNRRDEQCNLLSGCTLRLSGSLR